VSSIEGRRGADKGLRTSFNVRKAESQCSESRIRLILKERFDKKNLIVPGKVALLVIYVERGSRHGLDYLHFDLAPGRILHAMTG
jgi:hypothetical protein